MDIKELDKKQLILLVLLITFVVSIATGIITVSLMKQMPSSVPQTINNVIQRTIEKVTTVEIPAPSSNVSENNTQNNFTQNPSVIVGDKEALVSIYLNNKTDIVSGADQVGGKKEIEPIGQGVIVSEIGLILVDSSLINETDKYKVVLNKIDFNVEILKKFNNGFTILKISPATTNKTTENLETPSQTE